MFRDEFLQQDLRESNADLLYVTAIALERIYFNPRAAKIAKGRKKYPKFRTNSLLKQMFQPKYV